MAFSLQDFLSQVDFTGYANISGALLNNGYATLVPNPDANPLQGFGIVMVTIDPNADQPNVPDPTVSADYAKWKRYVWVRIPNINDPGLHPIIFAWVDTGVSDPTFLKWVMCQEDLTAIRNNIAALQLSVQAAAAAANTANTNSTNALNTANVANTTAISASSTATNAVATAATAVTSATAANTTAAAAVTSASQATTSANNAVAVANAATTTVNNAVLGIAGAWVNFSYAGSTITINNQFNVASVVHNATGKFTVTFTTAFTAGNLATIAMPQISSGGGSLITTLSSSDTGSASQVIIQVLTPTNGNPTDPATNVIVVVFGPH